MNIDRKKRLLGLVAALFLILPFCSVTQVYAADGRLSIAVSSSSVSVGDTVTVTLRAAGASGEGAVSDMEFTYNSSVFSFVSCDSDSYGGGSGGTVTANGSTVRIVLRAESSGSSNLKVTGSNGRVSSSGEALDSMVAAGATIEAIGSGTGANTANTTNTSGDNSLSALTLSAGTLSPEFAYDVTEYTASVPYEVESLEITAQPSNSGATIDSITDTSQLQVGENAVTITVKAPNGAIAEYHLVVTREVQVEGTETGVITEETTPQENLEEESEVTLEEQISILEERYNQLAERYQAQRSSSRRTIAILVFLVLVLAIVCVNIILFSKRRRDMEAEDVLEEVESEDTEDWLDEEENQAEDWLDDADSAKNTGKSREGFAKPKEGISKRKEDDIEIIDLDKL